MWQCCTLEALCDACAQVVGVLERLKEVAVLVDARHAKRVVHTADLQAAAATHTHGASAVMVEQGCSLLVLGQVCAATSGTCLGSATGLRESHSTRQGPCRLYQLPGCMQTDPQLPHGPAVPGSGWFQGVLRPHFLTPSLTLSTHPNDQHVIVQCEAFLGCVVSWEACCDLFVHGVDACAHSLKVPTLQQHTSGQHRRVDLSCFCVDLKRGDGCKYACTS